jgi:hypothetical protein
VGAGVVYLLYIIVKPVSSILAPAAELINEILGG